MRGTAFFYAKMRVFFFRQIKVPPIDPYFSTTLFSLFTLTNTRAPRAPKCGVPHFFTKVPAVGFFAKLSPAVECTAVEPIAGQPRISFFGLPPTLFAKAVLSFFHLRILGYPLVRGNSV